MKRFILSVRILARFKASTFINLLGLVFSISCALIIIRYIHQERQVNHFCPALERSYLMTVVNEAKQRRLGGSEDLNHDPNYRNPLEDPCVEMVTRFRLYDEDYVLSGSHRFPVQTVVTDSLFLAMLPYPGIEGDLRMRSPHDAIITKQLADRLYGNENPIGQTLQTSGGEMVTVTGVIGEPATKSFLQFDLILSENLHKFWNKMEYELVRLHSPEDAIRLNQKNSRPMKLRAYSQSPVYYELIPLKDFYMDTTVRSANDKMMAKGNPVSLKILSWVVLMLLLVGGFNYVNLNTVIMLKRSKELGMKKVFGAKGYEIFAQLYLENFCLIAISLLLTWTIVEVTRGIVAQWFGIPVMQDMRFDIMLSLAFLFLMPWIVTLFPYLRYRYVQPIRSLRGIGGGGHAHSVHILFLLFQYIITIGLIIVSIYFSKQLHYVLNFDLGYHTKDIIQCTLLQEDTFSREFQSREEWEAYRERKEKVNALIKKRLDESPLFMHWTEGEAPNGTNFFPMQCTASTGERAELKIAFVDQSYMELFGFKPLDGRLWDNEKDKFTQYKFIINEAARKAFRIENIYEATIQPYKRLWFSVYGDMDVNPPYEITGVVKDFRLNHLSQPDSPTAFCFSDIGEVSHILASIVPGKRQEAIAYLDKLFHELNGDGEFEYSFVEDDIAARYQDDKRVVRIYTVFAVITILISCLGLFGLSLYDIQQRQREIALRKINGASSHAIFKLLLRKYAYTLGLAFVVASALSCIVVQKYMESFYYHTSLSLWIFLLAALIVVVTSLCTIGWQIGRAMRINPVEAIKNE